MFHATAPFRDRDQAGEVLAERLRAQRLVSPVVLALPRGGVPVAHAVGHLLQAPVDVLVVRKLGAPFDPELALGAIAEDGALYLDERTLPLADLSADMLEALIAEERHELDRRVAVFRQGRALPELRGRDVVLVDDGVATGATARAAIQCVRHKFPRRVIFAVPVASAQAARALRPLVDAFVCVHEDPELFAISRFYDQFEQLGDDEVLAMLAHERAGAPASP